MSDRDLVLALRALGERLEAEPTVDISGGVVSRLSAPTPRRRTRWRAAVVVIAASLVVGATAVAATPVLREAIWGWLAGSGVDVRIVERLPATVSTERLAGLGLGSEVSVSQAERALASPLPRLGLLGPTDRVYLAQAGTRSTVTMLWHSRDGLTTATGSSSVGALLTVRPSQDSADPWWVGKAVAPGSRIGFTTIHLAGEIEAVWIEGTPHAVTGIGGRRETFRLAANVLIWRLDGNVYRLESALERKAAVHVAESLETRITHR